MKAKTRHRLQKQGSVQENIFLKPYKLIRKRQITSLKKKLRKETKRHFTKEETSMTSKYMERCPMSTLIMEMLIKIITQPY